LGGHFADVHKRDQQTTFIHPNMPPVKSYTPLTPTAPLQSRWARFRRQTKPRFRTIPNRHDNCWIQSGVEVMRRAFQFAGVNFTKTLSRPNSILGKVLRDLETGHSGLEASPYAPLDSLMWALAGQKTGSFCGDYRLFDVLEFCVAGDEQLLQLCTFQNRGKHFYAPGKGTVQNTKTTTTILHVTQHMWENQNVPELVAHALSKYDPVKLPKMIFLQLLPRSSIAEKCGGLAVPMDLMVRGCGSMQRMVAVGYIFGNESHFIPVVKIAGDFYIADSMNGAILKRVPLLSEVNNRRYNEREYKVAVMDDVSCTMNSFVHDTLLRRLLLCVMDGRGYVRRACYA